MFGHVSAVRPSCIISLQHPWYTVRSLSLSDGAPLSPSVEHICNNPCTCDRATVYTKIVQTRRIATATGCSSIRRTTWRSNGALNDTDNSCSIKLDLPLLMKLSVQGASQKFEAAQPSTHWSVQTTACERTGHYLVRHTDGLLQTWAFGGAGRPIWSRHTVAGMLGEQIKLTLSS